VSISSVDIDELVSVATEAASAGAQTALQWWHRRAELTVETKSGPDDLVSAADREAESAIRDVLSRLRPRDAVHGEEGGASDVAADVLWWLDPIDGTTSFLYGRADWSVSVAAMDTGSGEILAGVVCEPVLDRLTWAGSGAGTWAEGNRCQVNTPELARALVDLGLGRADQRLVASLVMGALTAPVRDIRRGGSAAAALAHLATGRCDAAWLPGLQPWDGAAGVLLAVEAGAAVGDLLAPSGNQWPAGGNVLAAGPDLWESLRELLAPLYVTG